MMSHQFRPSLSMILKRIYAIQRSVSGLVISFVVLILCTGCSGLPLSLTLQPPSIDLDLSIQQVQPSGRPGVYNIAGQTNLPDKTEITVSAIRYFQSDAPQFVSNKEFDTNYSILARRSVEVNQGTWQTSLALWQVAPDGKYQEVWQLDDSNLQLTPASEVTFLATLDPVRQPIDLRKQLKRQNKRFEGRLIRFTNDGEQYIQAVKAVALNLPTGRTNPPSTRPEDVNGGWGDRYLITQNNTGGNVTVPPVTVDLNNAPLSSQEFLR